MDRIEAMSGCNIGIYTNPDSLYVGIGTTVPLSAFHVRANTTGLGVVIDQAGTGGILDIRDAGVSKVVVDGAGNVGIGVAAPSYILDISNPVGIGTTTNSQNNLLRIIDPALGNNNTDTIILNHSRYANGITWEATSWKLQRKIDVTNHGYIEFGPNGDNVGIAFGTLNSEKMRINNNGNVGIGITNPLSLLNVNGSIQQGWGNFRLGAFYDTSYRQGLNYNTSTRTLQIFSCSGDTGGDILFSTSRNSVSGLDTNYGTDKMVITGNGLVGIGNTNPSTILNITSTAPILRMTANVENDATIQLLEFNNVSPSLGFEMKYQGVANRFEINRYNDSTSAQRVMTILRDNGYIGIGNDSPSFPLDVVGSFTTNVGTGQYFTGSSGGIGAYSGNANVGIKSVQSIWTTAGFIASSDTRIKTNIQNINDETALSQLRLLQPKTYEYIDKVQRGSDPVIGFIAQEVAEVLPRAVSKQKEIIPSVYAIASVVDGVLTLVKEHGFVVGDKVKLIKEEGGELITNIKTVFSSTSFTVEDPIESTETRIFVYGKEVPDFHTLDKNSIFTIGVAAVQELDRQVQSMKSRLEALEAKMNLLLNPS